MKFLCTGHLHVTHSYVWCVVGICSMCKLSTLLFKNIYVSVFLLLFFGKNENLDNRESWDIKYKRETTTISYFLFLLIFFQSTVWITTSLHSSFQRQPNQQAYCILVWGKKLYNHVYKYVCTIKWWTFTTKPAQNSIIFGRTIQFPWCTLQQPITLITMDSASNGPLLIFASLYSYHAFWCYYFTIFMHVYIKVLCTCQ